MTKQLPKTLSAILLATSALSAVAADYYVVVPVLGKRAPPPSISVALAQATLPPGMVGTLYPPFDLKNSLSVTGDPHFDAAQVAWDVTSGALPAGLQLAAGVVSGTPTSQTAGADFTVQASYKLQSGQQAYSIVVNGAPAPVGQIAYTTPGTFSFTAPAGVTSVSVVAVGGGAGGSNGNSPYVATATGGRGGGGGGLGWLNGIAVVPGQSYTVMVGAGGAAGRNSNGYTGKVGDASYFISLATVAGNGGGGTGNANLGDGGTFVGDGGGAGKASVGLIGGGGAGGYSGTIGAGGMGNFWSTYGVSSGGGGVGLMGLGASGFTPVATTDGGTGGSGGASGYSSISASGGGGGKFGGGGGSSYGEVSGAGSSGAVRIIWGPGRAFPSTLTADQ